MSKILTPDDLRKLRVRRGVGLRHRQPDIFPSGQVQNVTGQLAGPVLLGDPGTWRKIPFLLRDQDTYTPIGVWQPPAGQVIIRARILFGDLDPFFVKPEAAICRNGQPVYTLGSHIDACEDGYKHSKNLLVLRWLGDCRGGRGI